MINLSSKTDLDRVIRDNERVVVLFTSPAWCVPCQRFEPHWQGAESKVPGFIFIKIDADLADLELINEYNVMSVPTIFAFIHGEQYEVHSRTVAQLVKELGVLAYGDRIYN